MPDVKASFDINQPIERVWNFFQDIPQVVTCMPGLELIGQTGDSSYEGKVKIKLGPITAAFQGEATILSVDPTAYSARIEATGVDSQGGNRAAAELNYEITNGEQGTHVGLYGNIKLTGALAQMGRSGIIQDVANQLTIQFADNLRGKLSIEAPTADHAAAAPAAPTNASISGTSLVLGILWSRLKRTFMFILGRPD